MQILITGVAGFIGSNLAAEALARGYKVVGLDNMSQGDPLNLASLSDHPGFTFFKGDICEKGDLLEASENCDCFVHLAAFKIPRYSDALDTLRINGFGSDLVAQVAAERKAKLVFASTSDVYGKNPEVPFSESSNLVMGNPDVRRWSYAISKMFEEQLFFAYKDRFGIDVVSLRFFGGYGPNQNLTWWGGPQSVFINAALDDQPMDIHGDGSQRRSFTYISDHIDGIMRTIEMSEANNLVFNIGNVREISILELSQLIWKLVRGDETPKINMVPYSTFGKYEDVQRRIPNIERARDILGFTPKVDLEDGLKRTIEWQVGRRGLMGTETNWPVQK